MMTLVLLAYLGGVLTIISPCILPVLPFVFARADQPFLRSGLPMLIGMAITFAAVATLAAVAGGWVVEANQYGRVIAVALLAAFGLTLVIPTLADRLMQPLVRLGARLSDSIGRGDAGDGSVVPSLLLGVATGLLWAPCAGPVLGLILTGAALNGANFNTSLLLLAYAIGAATSLALSLAVGGRVFAAMKRSLGAGEWIRRGLGVAVLIAVAAVASGIDTGLLTRLSLSGTASLEQTLIDRLHPRTAKATKGQNIAPADGAQVMNAPAMTGPVMNGPAMTGPSMTGPVMSGPAINGPSMNGPTMNGAAMSDTALSGPSMAMKAGPDAGTPSLGVEGGFPSLAGAAEWLNSPPLTAAELKGKVVLIDFWTYSCINCLRSVPYIRAWAEKYKDHGLVVIGVHTPEFAFERKVSNVRAAVDDLKIGYPVAIDNEYAIWRAFDNEYWPAHYFIDAQGRIRYHHFGEGNYDESERVIQKLLAEAGQSGFSSDTAEVKAAGAEAAADITEVQSPETYVGYARSENFISPGGVERDKQHVYSAALPQLNQWSLAGDWTVGGEHATLNTAGGRVIYRFHARDLHLVLGPGANGQPVRFRVTIDGEPPAGDHGTDTDAAGNGVVKEQRLYQLIRQNGAIADRTFAIEFLDPGVEAFAFTFG
jgi:cytochrome c biogenesis protein CcdA/thiol-disulfide isomerase/thioredoxin